MLVKTSPEMAWAMLKGMLQADTDTRAAYVGLLNWQEGSVTFTGLDGQPVKYWLATANGRNYLTKDEEFGEYRIISDQNDVIVSIGHWGDDSFDLNGLNLEGKVFGPFKFHP